MKNLIILILSVLAVKGIAQSDSTSSNLTISGYVETYYSYDFGNPDNHNRPGFLYSHNRHNEINLNLGLLKAAYQTDHVRANLSLMTGTYPNANLAAEPGVLKNIYEANAGIKISKQKNIWIDAGIFPSHIGFESAIGKDNWTLTRSLNAENTPYFETGAKITCITEDGRWLLSGLVLNGWQRIQRIDGNHTPAIGHQLVYKPNDKITLNSSSFIGNDKHDSISQMRYFHNIYGIFQLSDKVGLTAGLDLGAEQISKGSKQYNVWYNPVMIFRFLPHDLHNITVRAEYYVDEKGVIVSTGTANGFQTWGFSLNYDYLIRDNIIWRVEARSLSSKDEIFLKNNKSGNHHIGLTTSLAVSF
ncbi:MAG TPA: porin [Saprospiraceae bacterium]|jgi:hypothetical protein|nr:porin [Saprospiraceae bacterium]HRO73269.1 porin [Saprospiraceae bacterium]HRP42883.1 porin [Saprospiraceae bacterium]